MIEDQRVFSREGFSGVCLKIHRSVGDQISFFVVARQIPDSLSERVTKCGEQIERRLFEPSRFGLHQLATADFIGIETFGTVFNQRAWTHVVVRRDKKRA